MCGIAGCVVHPGGTPDPAKLERMAHALGHRGPDDRGIEVVGSVGLVHTRLAIVDPSPAGHQPMRSPDGRWWITYNGEVFNHLELREQLPPAGYAGGTDTETLLHALSSWGEGAVPRCNGLFAYAAVDLDRRRLLLVRDRFGVKPLYMARLNDELWFASEMGALLEAGVPARPAIDLVGHAVAYGWVNGPATPLEGIERLMPGELISVDLDTLGATRRRWYAPEWDVDPDLGAELARCGRHELGARIEERLRTSVRRRLMADVPVGTMCSGGLDSSLVASLAAEQHPSIHAFNASVVDQPEHDEGPWAEQVADALGIELHTTRLTGSSWRAGLVETVLHTEYPLTHESSVPMAQIAHLARDRGVKVLLSGEGADELFGGYHWTNAAEYRDFLARNPVGRTARALYRRLKRGGILRSPADPRGEPATEVAEFEDGVRHRAHDAYRHHRGARRRLEAACLADLSTYLPHLLNRQDKNTMQGSIETRVPFLDPELVALAVNLPLEARVVPRRKELLRDVAERRLPRRIASRPKIGFGFDVARYIQPAARPGFVIDGRLRELFGLPRDQWRETVQGFTSAPALRFWTGEIWCRAFLDRSSRESIESELWGSA